MSRPVNIGLIQLQSKLGDVPHNVAKAQAKIKEAADQGAQIVCLPELFATGYDLATMKDSVIDVSRTYESDIKKGMSEAAKENQVYVIAPYVTFKGVREAPYNSAVLFDDEGNEVGEFSKSHLWALDQEHFEAGSEYPVFDTKYGKIGLLICYDAGFPEASRMLCLKGAEVVFYPSAWRELDEDIWDLNLRQRALENIYFAVGVNSYDPSPTTQLFGKSKVCDPRGRVLSELAKNEDSLRVVEIDLAEVEKQREDIPYLKDRKPELYREVITI